MQVTLTDRRPVLLNTRFSGGPGAGKTERLIRELKALRKGCMPHQHIVVIMFSKDAQGSFEKRCKLAGLRNVAVKTFHKLSTDTFLHFTGRRCNVGIVREAALRELAKQVLPQLQQHFRHLVLLVVDEAQDMTDVDSRIVRFLQKSLKCKVWLTDFLKSPQSS